MGFIQYLMRAIKQITNALTDCFKEHKLNKIISVIIFVILNTCLMSRAHGIYTDVQSGSLMGMVHVSVGDHFFDNHHLSAGVGYVPKLNNHREMSMVSFRYRYQHPSTFTFNTAERTWSLSLLNFGVGR